MVVCVPLQVVVGNFLVALNEGVVLSFFRYNRRSVEIDLVVDDEKRVVSINDVVVNRNTIQVLFKKVFEEHILLIESGLLLLDCQLVEVNLIVAFVEVVEHFEFIEGVLVKTSDLLDFHIWIFGGVSV
jgi:hypothetical protein